MRSAAIQVERLSKEYVIGGREGGRETFREMIVGAMAAPFRRFRILNGDVAAEQRFWALKGIDFEVQPGEVIGIIGRNGAGKSTLLKILSRITEPTVGKVRIRGRVASLLEVGTGFHPELTGRENIYLNGAILGMSRSEIDRNFDEIVAFAEVEKFLDTPVKRYSSGMQVRLAFAVAAHLDADILLIDEVLAVGDAQFQQKCISKMDSVRRTGKTVLFVSHNLGAVSRLCSRVLWLEAGALVKQGASRELIPNYLGSVGTGTAERVWSGIASSGQKVVLRAVRIYQPPGELAANLDITKPMHIEIEVEVLVFIPEFNLGYQIVASDGTIALHSSDLFACSARPKQPGIWKFRSALPAYTLNAGAYTVTICSDIPYQEVLLIEDNVLEFSVDQTCPIMGRYYREAWRGIIGPGLATWSIECLSQQTERLAHDVNAQTGGG